MEQDLVIEDSEIEQEFEHVELDQYPVDNSLNYLILHREGEFE